MHLSSPASVEISRPAQHGGPLKVSGASWSADLDALFTSEQLHPGDLKAAVETYLTTGFQTRLAAHLPSLAEVAGLMDAAFPPLQKKGAVKKAGSSVKKKKSPDTPIGKIEAGDGISETAKTNSTVVKGWSLEWWICNIFNEISISLF